jgi:hypothetical protein
MSRDVGERKASTPGHSLRNAAKNKANQNKTRVGGAATPGWVALRWVAWWWRGGWRYEVAAVRRAANMGTAVHETQQTAHPLCHQATRQQLDSCGSSIIHRTALVPSPGVASITCQVERVKPSAEGPPWGGDVRLREGECANRVRVRRFSLLAKKNQVVVLASIVVVNHDLRCQLADRAVDGRWRSRQLRF